MTRYLANRCQRGFTLVEIVVGSAILSVSVLICFSIITVVTEEYKKLSHRAQASQLVKSFLANLSSEVRNDPAQVVGPQAYDPSFDPLSSAANTTLTCFDRTGLRVALDNAACFYRITYIVLQIMDSRMLSTSDLAPLPLKRIFMRIDYTENEIAKSVRLSQLLTPVLMQ